MDHSPMKLKLNPKQVKGVSKTNYNVIASWKISNNHVVLNNHVALLVDCDVADIIVLDISNNAAIIYGSIVKAVKERLCDNIKSGEKSFCINSLQYNITKEKELTELLDRQWDVKYKSTHFVDER